MFPYFLYFTLNGLFCNDASTMTKRPFWALCCRSLQCPEPGLIKSGPRHTALDSGACLIEVTEKLRHSSLYSKSRPDSVEIICTGSNIMSQPSSQHRVGIDRWQLSPLAAACWARGVRLLINTENTEPRQPGQGSLSISCWQWIIWIWM